MKHPRLRTLPCKIPGLDDLSASLLYSRDIRTLEEAERFLDPRYEDLADPGLYWDMDKACDEIRRAKQEGIPCVVYGDYDADGICASVLLIEALKTFGLEAVSYIPDRQEEGYGLNEQAIRALAPHYGLLISVDCGAASPKECALAKELKMRVIITDHHKIPEDRPYPDAFLHPERCDSAKPTPLCGAGMAFQLAQALNGEAARAQLDLAAIATIADMVPLLQDNRILASLGLKQLALSKRPGIQALKRIASLEEGSLEAEQLAFQLIPRLNATGRLESAEKALRLLMSHDEQEAQGLAVQLDQLNLERRELQEQVTAEAKKQAEQKDLFQQRSLVLAGEGWNRGVVGLAASKLAERYDTPTLVLSLDKGLYVGSGRSACGIDLYQALNQCRDLFLHFGGHAMAAGLTLPEEKLPELENRFDEAVKEQLGEGDLIRDLEYDAVLSLAMVSKELISQLKRFEPFGMSNPRPLFCFEGLEARAVRPVGAEGKHLKLQLFRDGVSLDAIAFNKTETLISKNFCVYAEMELNCFRGQERLQLKIREIYPDKSASKEDSFGDSLSIMKELWISASKKAVPSLTPGDKTALPELPVRGALVACHTWESLEELHARFPKLPIAEGHARDPRAFTTLLYRPRWDEAMAPYQELWLADGLLWEGEANRAQEACKAIAIHALPRSRALKKQLEAFQISVQELRELYRFYRFSPESTAPFSSEKMLSGRCILSQAGLMTLDEQLNFADLLPPERCDPSQTPLYRLLQASK